MPPRAASNLGEKEGAAAPGELADSDRRRTRSYSSRASSPDRPEHMSCGHHVPSQARTVGTAGDAVLRTQQAPRQRVTAPLATCIVVAVGKVHGCNDNGAPATAMVAAADVPAALLKKFLW